MIASEKGPRQNREEEESQRFNLTTWRRFWRVARLYFVSEKKFEAFGLLALLAIFSISMNGLNVLMNFVGRDFINALSRKEKADFFYQLYLYLGAFLFATPVVVFYRYVEERMGLMWRRWLSLKLIGYYFSNRAYYKINTEAFIDNPDQRIEEDIRTFTVLTLSFLLIIFNSLIALFAFMGILWSISVPLTLAAVAYAVFGSVATYYLGRPLIPLNFTQLKREGDYRYKLINVRDHAESIAFYGNEEKERTRVRQRLNRALDNFRSIIDWNRNLGFFRTGYNYVITILPTVIVAPLYLDGTIEFGVVTQATVAFGQVLGALSIIVSNFGGLSAFAAVVTRLGTFWEVVVETESSNCFHGQQSLIEVADAKHVRFVDVTIQTPLTNEVVVRSLDFAIGANEPLLICGPSGSGKSSILRTMAGLWNNGKGRVERPPLASAMFVPQRPYMVLGTLRSQLLYGLRRKVFSDTELLQVIDQLHLNEMLVRVGGLESVLDWGTLLSTGEQQRIGIARVLLARPQLVVLDEATTGIDAEGVEEIYSFIKPFASSYISVGHRDLLQHHHHFILELSANGAWSLREVGK